MRSRHLDGPSRAFFQKPRWRVRRVALLRQSGPASSSKQSSNRSIIHLGLQKPSKVVQPNCDSLMIIAERFPRNFKSATIQRLGVSVAALDIQQPS
mmetsp:Transcript_22409/g.70185  ORF Transcript_22409/g.70185 Transcript_22409/m.70185 type:complete len:96 (+) Transcript_22409:628-915(+)